MERRTFLKLAGVVSASAISGAGPWVRSLAAGAKSRQKPILKNEILNKIMSIKKGTAICWLGNIGWLIRADGCLAAFDLVLDYEKRLEEPPISSEELASVLDVHFITHEHGDHFNRRTSKVLAEKSKCQFVVPSNCVETAKKIGVPPKRIRIARPREAFQLGKIHVEPVRAIHGNMKFTVAHFSNNDDCGYLLTIGGKKFFQPGDTVLLQEHLDLKDVDVLFVSPTVHNMYIDRSAILINAIEPAYIFPQHFGSFVQTERDLFWTKGYPDELKVILPKSMQSRFHKLKQGQVFLIE
ncbi:MAG: MBL fold metallo-hydrolase [Planctomycetota bacterium]|jgi:L-ascorbate metabolism protein UlaG (beta-lactamase superfamily)